MFCCVLWSILVPYVTNVPSHTSSFQEAGVYLGPWLPGSVLLLTAGIMFVYVRVLCGHEANPCGGNQCDAPGIGLQYTDLATWARFPLLLASAILNFQLADTFSLSSMSTADLTTIGSGSSIQLQSLKSQCGGHRCALYEVVWKSLRDASCSGSNAYDVYAVCTDLNGEANCSLAFDDITKAAQMVAAFQAVA